MKGAQSLIQTLVNGGVEVCFMNPGTSEMHFVAALDSVPGMRPVLGLFEGVCTGAADGYARMAGKPAATLLHLGPGLANGIANLHNARRAHTPLVNIVGDHATYHRQYDAPLTSDICSLAKAVSGWVRSATDAASLAADGVDAMVAAQTPPGQVATLILPADCAWNEGSEPVIPPAIPPAAAVEAAAVQQVADVLGRDEPAVLLLGGKALTETGMRLADRIAQASGARIVGDRVVGRIQRGAGRPRIERLPYPVDSAVALLAGTAHLVLAGASSPVAFFAYPDKPSLLAPADCQIHTLATPDQDVVGALAALAERLGAPPEPVTLATLARPPLPSGELSAEKVWMALTALMPEAAIVADEAITSGREAAAWTASAPPHDWLHITGGAIGQGLPLATGAAVACPDRQVFAMQSDGAAMYTLQALWTQAREQLDIVTVLFSNRSYAILQGELQRVGADRLGPKAMAMLDLGDPALNWMELARGMGVEASRADSAEDFVGQLKAAIQTPGPHLIEVPL